MNIDILKETSLKGLTKRSSKDNDIKNNSMDSSVSVGIQVQPDINEYLSKSKSNILFNIYIYYYIILIW